MRTLLWGMLVCLIAVCGCRKKSNAPAGGAGLIYACIAFDANCAAYTFHEGGMARYENRSEGSRDRTTLFCDIKTVDGSPILTLEGTCKVDGDDLATISLVISVQRKSGIKLDGIPKYEAVLDGAKIDGPILLEPGQHKLDVKGIVEFVYEPVP